MKRKPTILEWLGFRRDPDFRKIMWLGPMITVALVILGLVLFLPPFIEFIRAATGIDTFENEEAQSAAIRNTGLVLAAMIGVPFLVWRSIVAQRQVDTAQESLFNDKINAASADLYAMRQISRKVTDPQAGLILRDMWEDDVVRRNAAIDRLEGLVRERPEMAGRVSRMLGAYVREVSAEIFPGEMKEGDEVVAARSDLEKAAQTLGRLRAIEGVVPEEVEQDLRGAWLSKGDYGDLNFEGARLEDANLNKAWLNDVNLRKAQLNRANLQEAWLESAILQEAQLNDAKLQEAQLDCANLQEAQLNCANLQETRFGDANLQGAELCGANLKRARLGGAQLQMAQLDHANLQEAWIVYSKLKSTFLSNCRMSATLLRLVDLSDTLALTQSQVNSSFGVRDGFGRVLLPDGITPPDHWHVALRTKNESGELIGAFDEAYAQWLAARREDAED